MLYKRNEMDYKLKEKIWKKDYEQLASIKEKYEKINKNYSKLSEVEKKIKNIINKKNKEIDDLENKLTENTRILQRQQEKMNLLQEEWVAKETTIGIQNENLKKRLSQKTEEIENLEKENSNLTKEMNDIKNLHIELEKKLSEVKLSSEGYKSQIKHLEKSLAENSSNFFELNKQYYDNLKKYQEDNLYMNNTPLSIGLTNLYNSTPSYCDHDLDYSLNLNKNYINLSEFSSPSLKSRELNNFNLKQIHENIELINNHINNKVKSQISKSP